MLQFQNTSINLRISYIFWFLIKCALVTIQEGKSYVFFIVYTDICQINTYLILYKSVGGMLPNLEQNLNTIWM